MNSFKFDVGWLYLIAGLLMAVVAIVLPAMIELEQLSSRVAASNQQLQEQETMFASYTSFYEDMSSNDASIMQRVRQIQLNEVAEGTPIVTDLSASKTPLQWVDEKVLAVTSLSIEKENRSSLSRILSGSGRLWMAAFGVFFIYIGCIK